MKKLFVLGLLLFARFAHADEYSCKVYCNSGETYVSVTASSKADAAAKIDGKADQICKSEGKENATIKTMRPSQCERK